MPKGFSSSSTAVDDLVLKYALDGNEGTRLNNGRGIVEAYLPAPASPAVPTPHLILLLAVASLSHSKIVAVAESQSAVLVVQALLMQGHALVVHVADYASPGRGRRCGRLRLARGARSAKIANNLICRWRDQRGEQRLLHSLPSQSKTPAPA